MIVQQDWVITFILSRGDIMEKSRFSIDVTNTIKGVAILVLLAYHLFVRSDYSLYNYNFTVGGKPFLNFLMQNGKVCVTIFVFLSGYGLNISYNKKAPKEPTIKENILFNFKFSTKHILKLISNLIVIYFIFLLIGLLLGKTTLPGIYGENISKGVIIDMLGLQYLFNSPTLNVTWWYMSAIICYYALFPLLKVLMRKAPLLPMLIGLSINILALYYTWYQLTVGILFYIFAFVCGMFFSEYKIFEKETLFDKKTIFYEIILFVITYFLRAKQRYVGDFAHAISVICLVYSIYPYMGKLNKVLNLLGRHSANIFMLHTFFMLIYFQEFIYGFKNTFIIYIVLIIISLICSIIIEFIKRLCRYDKLQRKLFSIK